MQEAGVVLHLARSGRLILRANSQIKEGTILVDESGKMAGKVMETIGPVSAPYLSAQLLTNRIERLLGQKLFVSEFEGKRNRGRSQRMDMHRMRR